MPTKQKLTENRRSLWQIPPLREADHKYSRGHVLIFGGGVMTGASRLSALAAQRAGAGVVTLAVPARAFPIYAVSMLSVIVRELVAPGDFPDVIKHCKVNTVLLGPGAQTKELRAPLKAAIKSGLPLVLDAGALTLLAEDAKLRGKLPAGNFVITPHEGEYKKLVAALGIKPPADKPGKAIQLAKALGGVVLLKGAETIIADSKGRVVRHKANAPWLATAGTGDILAGIIAALVGQGMSLFDAACAGAYLHSQAAEPFGHGMIAEDLIGLIPAALQSLE